MLWNKVEKKKQGFFCFCIGKLGSSVKIVVLQCRFCTDHFVRLKWRLKKWTILQRTASVAWDTFAEWGSVLGGLLRLFAVSFCLCTTGTTYSASWYPSLSFSVFSILFDFAIWPPTLNFFFLRLYFLNSLYVLFWKFAACSFPIFDRLKTPVLLCFEKKSHVINRKREHCPTF